MRGTIADNLDGVQFLLVAFFIGFAILIYYLRREDKREGYPLRDISPVRRDIEGFPEMPEPKPYRTVEGRITAMPHRYAPSQVRGERLLRFPGAPLVPVGDPMLAELGPGAYPLRADAPLLSEGTPQVQPLRVAEGWRVARGERDPTGLAVYDPHHTLVGHVDDLWVDRSIKILRYLEVVPVAGLRRARVLVPVYSVEIHRRWLRLTAMLAHDFVKAPVLASPDCITAREEDRVNAFFASGVMFSRQGFGGLPTAAVAGHELP